MTVVLQALLVLVLHPPINVLNAWDAYESTRLAARVKAMRARGEPATLAELAKTYPDPPKGRNAAAPLNAAFRLIEQGRLDNAGHLPILGDGQLPPLDQEFPPGLLKAIREHVREGSDALRLLHEAAEMGEAKFDLDFAKGLGMLLPHLSKMRGAVRLLALEAVERTESGRPDEAANSLWAALRLGHALHREPILISGLVRIASDSITVGQIERLVSRAELSAKALQKLEAALRDEADPKLLERVFIGERCFGMDAYQTYFLGAGGPRRDALNALGGGPAVPPLINVVPRAYFKADLVHYVDFMTEYVVAAGKPYPQGVLEGARLGRTFDERVPAYFPISRMLLPALWRTFTSGQQHLAKMHTARLALATLRYKAERRRLPDGLQELIPKFADAVPLDPFDGKPLRYQREVGGFAVYSVGENGRDDGGDTEILQGRFPDVGFRVRWPKARF